MSLVFLIGMPGAGKSHWGRQIAQRYMIPFTDLDKYIIHLEQCNIPDLFQKYGEELFRQKEHEYLKRLIYEAKPGTVIAAGGGTPCFLGNMELMKQAGTTVYLKAAPERLLQNMRFTLEMRPLLRDKEDINAFLNNMLAHRKQYYEQADYILQTQDISIAIFGQIFT